MLAEPDMDMDKVRQLVSKLSKFHWSVKPPEQCVLPDGSGIGRLAYENMAAFNLAWCYHKPVNAEGHNLAIASFVLLKEPLKVRYGSLTLEDAVMLLSKPEFYMWVSTHRFNLGIPLYEFLIKVVNNSGTH